MAHRKIVVAEVSYHWNVTAVDPRNIKLTIWRADNRGATLRIAGRYDNPWYFIPELAHGDPAKVEREFQSQPITPAIVRQAIEQCLTLGWHDANARADFHATWDGKTVSPAPHST